MKQDDISVDEIKERILHVLEERQSRAYADELESVRLKGTRRENLIVKIKGHPLLKNSPVLYGFAKRTYHLMLGVFNRK